MNFFGIELLYFAVMIAIFVVLLLKAKLPSGHCMMIAALVGGILAAIISSTEFGLRHLVEGPFAYLDTILVITTAMVFMGAMEASGALEYISAALVKAFRRFPALLLISFMFIIMFPAMVTGSSLASAISAGALVAPVMIKWGIPKARTGAIIAVGSLLGMVAPPVNIPAMVICEVVDIPYTGFTLPLLILTLPLAIVSVLLLGRKFVKPMTKEQVEMVVNTKIFDELNFTVCIPLFVLIGLIVGEMIFPKVLGSFAMPGMFVVSTIICVFTGKRLPFFKKSAIKSDFSEELSYKNPESVVEMLKNGVLKALPAMGLLMGVGMFMQIITLNGARGNVVSIPTALPGILKYISMAIVLPLFGGISAYGSASVLGGPFVMALLGVHAEIIVTCGLSLLAAMGETLPPTAMSSTLSAKLVGEKKWSSVTKSALPALGIIFVYTLIFTILLSSLVQKNLVGLPVVLIIVAALAIVFAVVYEILIFKVKRFSKDAHDVCLEIETNNTKSEGQDL